MLSGSDFWGWAFESYVCFRLLPLKMPVLHTIMRTRHCHTFPLPEVSAPCIYHSNGMILLTNHDPNETFPPFSWFCQVLCHNEKSNTQDGGGFHQHFKGGMEKNGIVGYI